MSKSKGDIYEVLALLKLGRLIIEETEIKKEKGWKNEC